MCNVVRMITQSNRFLYQMQLSLLQKGEQMVEKLPRQAAALDSGLPQTSYKYFWSMVQWLEKPNSKDKVERGMIECIKPQQIKFHSRLSKEYWNIGISNTNTLFFMFCIYWISFNCMKSSVLKPSNINFIGFKENRLGIWGRTIFFLQYRFYGFAEGSFKNVWSAACLKLLTFLVGGKAREGIES